MTIGTSFNEKLAQFSSERQARIKSEADRLEADMTRDGKPGFIEGHGGGIEPYDPDWPRDGLRRLTALMRACHDHPPIPRWAAAATRKDAGRQVHKSAVGLTGMSLHPNPL